MKYPLRVLSAVAGLSFLFTICFLLWPTELKERLGDDVFKLTYQFLLLVVIGGALSVVYQEFQHRRDDEATKFQQRRDDEAKDLQRRRDDEAKQREQDAARREAERVLQRQFLGDVLEAYKAAKKVRRLLRAKARKYIPETRVALVDAKPYEEQMLFLLDIQLDFESLKRRAKSISRSPPINTELAVKLESIEKYLNHIVDEYSDHFSEFTGQPPRRQLNEICHVAEFIAKRDPQSKFATEFQEPFHAAVETLQTLIIQ
jgi:hypothetical protein